MIKGSPLLGKFPMTIIPNGIDIQKVKPRDWRISREMLGIEEGVNVIKFTSDDMNNRRKGFGLLFEALNRLEEESDLLLLSALNEGIGRG